MLDQYRADLHSLLSGNGFVRTVCVEQDDVYVHKKLIEEYDTLIDPRTCGSSQFLAPCDDVRTLCPSGTPPSSCTHEPSLESYPTITKACKEQTFDDVSCLRMLHHIKSKCLSTTSDIVGFPVVRNSSFLLPVDIRSGEGASEAHFETVHMSAFSDYQLVARKFCADNAIIGSGCPELLLDAMFKETETKRREATQAALREDVRAIMFPS
jgi:hypothetical protein